MSSTVKRPVWEGTAASCLGMRLSLGADPPAQSDLHRLQPWQLDLASRETLRQNHPAKSLPDSWPQETCCLVTKSCSTLCDPMDCSPPGSSVHGISQTRMLERVDIPSPGDLPDPGIEPTHPLLGRWILYHYETIPAMRQWWINTSMLSKWRVPQGWIILGWSPGGRLSSALRLLHISQSLQTERNSSNLEEMSFK